MTGNLKHSPEGLTEAFKEHLLYEVTMLRHTFLMLHAPQDNKVIVNALIESYCVHARNLIEFFDTQSTLGGTNVIGAVHFTENYKPWAFGAPTNYFKNKLNRQISHLTYERSTLADDKISATDRRELLQLLERELEEFAKQLKPKYAALWPNDAARQSAQTITVDSLHPTATNAIMTSESVSPPSWDEYQRGVRGHGDNKGPTGPVSYTGPIKFVEPPKDG